jgi:hypothetical protein
MVRFFRLSPFSSHQGDLFEKTAPLDPRNFRKSFLLDKSFSGVQGAVFQKSPLAAGGKKKLLFSSDYVIQ